MSFCNLDRSACARQLSSGSAVVTDSAQDLARTNSIKS